MRNCFDRFLSAPFFASVFVFVTLGSCGDGARFGAGRTVESRQAKRFAAEAVPEIPLGFRLVPSRAGQIFGPGVVELQPSLFDLRKKTRALREESSWLVTLLGPGGEVLSPEGGVTARSVDFSNGLSGDIKLTASFRERDGRRRGKATTVIRIDADAPQTSVLWSREEGSGKVFVRWDVLDSADFDPMNSQLIVCRSETDLASFQKKNFTEREADPLCQVLAVGPSFTSEGVLEIEKARIDVISAPGQEPVFAALTTDRFRNAGAFRGKYLEQGKSSLSLESLKDSPLLFSSFPVALDLLLKEVSPLQTLPIGANRASEFEIVLVDSKGVEWVLPFDASLRLPPAFEQQGNQLLALFARKVLQPEVRSNTVKVAFLVDTVAPVVTKPSVIVDGGVLSPGAITEIFWQVEEAGRVEAQTLEWRALGEAEWRSLGDVPKEVRSVSMPWSATPAKLGALEVRVSAVDAQGLRGFASTEWREQFFNAAVLTKSVECFWCHMEISGHVAGIFPSNASPKVHADTGTNLAVTGNFFSNANFPGAGMPAVFPPERRKANYANTELPIFPKNNEWPVIDPEVLRVRMNGYLKGHDPVENKAVYIDRVLSGNVVLKGTTQNPLVLSGEVFIDGDLVISGQYKGIGTLYARNVFIVDDLVAVDSPYPYPDEEQAALAAGREAVRTKKDALYLAALSDIVVGAPEARSSETCSSQDVTVGGKLFKNFLSCVSNMPLDKNVSGKAGARTIAHPYAWLPKGVFQSLGRRAEPPTVTAYAKLDATIQKPMRVIMDSSHYADETYDSGGVLKVRDTMATDRTALEVSRVDAFLYATEAFQARVYVNLVINGGVMSPKVEMFSAYANSSLGNLESRLEDSTFRFGRVDQMERPALNERNGLTLHRNAIRYDWRLRTGGKGLGVLKEFFR